MRFAPITAFAVIVATTLTLTPAVRAQQDDTVRCTPNPPTDLGVIGSGVWSASPGAPENQSLDRPSSRAGDSGATCESSSDPNVPATRSGLGALTTRDSSGNMVYGLPDASGVTTFRPTSPPLTPPTFTTTPDGIGGTIFRDSSGRVYNPPTDGLGNSTFHTDDGRVVRCHTIQPTGQTVCD